MTDRVKSILWGAVGMVGVALVLAVLALSWITYQRAEHGQEAYEYLQRVIQQQQKAPLPGK